MYLEVHTYAITKVFRMEKMSFMTLTSKDKDQPKPILSDDFSG